MQANPLRILLIEDNPGDARLIRGLLAEANAAFEVVLADRVSAGLEHLDAGGIDVVLLDLSLSDSQGLDTFAKVRAHAPAVPIVVLTGLDDEENAAQAVHAGAQDYLVKGTVDGNLLRRAIRYAIERQRIMEDLRASRERLRNLAARLHAVREEERTVMAQEIHDELGQALTGLKMDLSWLRDKLPKNRKPLLERTSAMLALVDSTLDNVRKLASGLRPGVLDDLGLEAAIEWQAQEFESRTGCQCELSLEAEEVGVDPACSTAVFRILQEALTNVARHAEASRVEINLRMQDGELVLEVKDNGKGITQNEITNNRSLGLIGMVERAGAFGGQVDIQSMAKVDGTVVALRIPLAAKEN